MSIVDHLIEQADGLSASTSAGRLRQADMRRAISTAYHAVFHELVGSVVASVRPVREVSSPVGLRLRRVVAHRSVNVASHWFAGMGVPPVAIADMFPPGFSPSQELRTLCKRVIKLQENRHAADYNLSWKVDTRGTRRLVEAAREGVALLRSLENSRQRTVFLIGYLLGTGAMRNAEE